MPGYADIRRPQVVLNGLQDLSLLGATFRQLQHSLRKAGKELLVPQPSALDVVVHLPLVAGLPELHQPVEAVDQRRRRTVRGRLAEALAAALVPCLEAHLAATRRLRCVFIVIILCPLTSATASQDVQASREVRVRHVAGQGVEDAGAAGSRLCAEVVAMQQVVGRHVVQLFRHAAVRAQ